MYIFVEANCLILCNPWFICACCVFRCLESIPSSTTHKIFEKLIQRKVPMCFVRLLKHRYKEQTVQIKWGKYFSGPFHVSNGVRQGRVLSPYLFAVYFDDLSNELTNIKAGYYIGEVLLNHLMFADDICVFCPSVRWLQRILDVCQAYAESHGIIFNCNKTVCMTFKAKSAKSTATPVLKLGSQYVKSVDQYKYVGILLDTELSDDKDIPRQLRYQYCAANKLRASFSRCSNAVKNVLFRSFSTPMYASQLWCNFRKSCMQKLRVAYNFGCRALYNLPWRASVSSHQVQCNIPTFEALLRKYTYLFLERCRKPNNVWLRALMQSDCLYSSLLFEHYNRILLCN